MLLQMNYLNFFYFSLYGCTGSLLLHEGVQSPQAAAAPSLRRVGFSLQRLPLSHSTGSRLCMSLSGCSTRV